MNPELTWSELKQELDVDQEVQRRSEWTPKLAIHKKYRAAKLLIRTAKSPTKVPAIVLHYIHCYKHLSISP
jgi:hypothetical protein